MKHQMYSIYDKVSKVYILPFYQSNERVAIRSFVSGMMDSTHQLSQHPHDFVLFHMGEFDDESGLTVQEKAGPIRVLDGLEAMRMKERMLQLQEDSKNPPIEKPASENERSA